MKNKMESTKQKHIYQAEFSREKDNEVNKMIESWDMVTCRYCLKKLSMLEAKMTPDGQYFICKEH